MTKKFARMSKSDSRRYFDTFGRLSEGARRFLLALAIFAAGAALAYVFFIFFGRRASLLYGLLYFVVLMSAAWMGYLSGLTVCSLATFALPRLFLAHPRPVDATRFGMLCLISLLVSHISAMIRRREQELRKSATELEQRVRERTDEAIRSAGRLHEQAQLLDLAHDAILSIETGGAISFWNRGAEKMYGYIAGEVLGRNAHDLLQTVFPEPVEAIEEKLALHGHWEGELLHRRRDGSLIRVSSRWAARGGAAGETLGWLEINTDVTEIRRIEEQLRHTQKLESLGVLAGGVAHDFNNLLTGILGNASLALETLPPRDPTRTMLEEVTKAAERAADLTRQLLAYAGKGRFVMKTVDLSALVREIDELIQASIPKHVQVREQLVHELPGIDCDPGQVQQIVMNLVMNGAEAIDPAGGTVLVRTFAQMADEDYLSSLSPGAALTPGQYVGLEVHDTGQGMDEATLSRIFDPFFTTKFAGRGLGLSAVQGIVQSHKGALKVYSQPGQGTTFQVLFPASVQPVLAPPASVAVPLPGSGVVLIADDEDTVRQIARHTLERYGYKTILAVNGSQAVDLYRCGARDIDLVLLDLTMPGDERRRGPDRDAEGQFQGAGAAFERLQRGGGRPPLRGKGPGRFYPETLHLRGAGRKGARGIENRPGGIGGKARPPAPARCMESGCIPLSAREPAGRLM